MPDTYMVAGAASGVGMHVTRKLLERGENVRAFVRNGRKLRDIFGTPDNLSIFVGDIADHAAAFEAAEGAHYVISTVGAKFPDGEPERVDYQGVHTLVNAAAEHGHIRQFVLVSSIGVTQGDHDLNARFKNVLRWKMFGENYLRGSGLSYAIVRPGGLSDDAGGTKSIEIGQGDNIHGAISRETVANVCIAICDAAEHVVREVTFEVIEGDGPAPADLENIFDNLKRD
ncbi:MAG: SDR family oxidoreductase [Chloroflexi bacterium]|nr:SDR family oxidoreductase [Chloroflexota bacterium]